MSGVEKTRIPVQTVVDLPAMSMHTSESASQVFPVPREAAVRKSAMRMHRQDLICYAGHVAIYMGGGKIVHAKGTAYGIVGNDNATYKTIITVRRLL